MTSGRSVNTTSQQWGTPRVYVDAVKEVFGGEIELDPCSNQFSIVEAKTEYSLPQSDGLVKSWDFATIYVNPPYGKDKERNTEIGDWLFRCAQAYEVHESEVIALLPTAANTNNWKHHIWGKATSICFLYDTRLKFLENGEETGKGSPIQNCVVYWGKKCAQNFFDVFSRHGAVVDITPLQSLEEIGGVKQITLNELTQIKEERRLKKLKKEDLILKAKEVGVDASGSKNNLIAAILEKQHITQESR